MHILLLPSWYPLTPDDLNGSFFREQAHALAKSGEKVGVIVPQFRSLRLGKQAVFGKYGLSFWQDGSIPTYFQHSVSWFPKVPHIDAKRWVSAGLKLFERYVEEQGKPDLLHVHSLTHAGPLALAIKQKHGIPYCVTEHSSVFGRNLLKSWEVPGLQHSAREATRLLAVSQNLANTVQEKLKVGKWEAFPNLLDNLFVETDSALVERKKQICAVAFLNKNKGFDLLVKAFAIVQKNIPDLKLVIGGDGPEKVKLEALIERLELQHQVTLLGALTRLQVRDLMRESQIFVLSSHVETFGVVVIEALSQGTPVVATRCGGPEGIITEQDGVLVAVNDERSLAEGIMHVLKKQSEFNHESIKTRCIETYSEAAFVKRLKHIYQDILKTSPSYD